MRRICIAVAGSAAERVVRSPADGLGGGGRGGRTDERHAVRNGEQKALSHHPMHCRPADAEHQLDGFCVGWLRVVNASDGRDVSVQGSRLDAFSGLRSNNGFAV